MSKWTRTTLILLLGFAIGCGSPRSKHDKGGKTDNDAVVICTGDDCEDEQTAQNNTCGVTSCDDQNACTVDHGDQNQSTCTTSCTYAAVDECVSGDGCCPSGCTMDDDSDCSDPSTSPVCTTECPAQQDECLAVVSTKDAQGCITACDYAPISGCGETSPNNTSPNNTSPNNTSPNNTSCQPSSCTSLGAVCGTLPDGCGGSVSCGSCGAGQVCTPGGECREEAPDCDPNVEGQCPNVTPYCILGVCSECVGTADCANGDLCVEGFCTKSPDCTVDPSVCPTGYDCVGGQCTAPVGEACDPNDPTSCPQGLFCDGATATCQGAGGDAGCGFCNPDCSCPGSLTCDGFLCSGCVPFGGEGEQCPEEQFCFPADPGICVPGFF